jgi:Domain of unknown function (DUF4268)
MTNAIPKLGRLRTVDLREVWPSEPQSFTPWLAQEDNLQFLAETIGLPSLEFVAMEQQVDIFSADIVAKIPTTGQTVLIENQIERTDHKHLGQVLTYAAGLDAAVIIWVAREFAEGHRATLDWLNHITGDQFFFFGIEVEAVRIGESEPAPRFNVIARPNAWTRQVQAASASVELTGSALSHYEYWLAYEEVAKVAVSPVRKGTQPIKSSNYYVRIGTKGDCWLTACRGLSSGTICAYLALYGPQEAIYNALLARQSDIERAFGGPLDWQVRKAGRTYWVSTQQLEASPNETDWPRQHSWLADVMRRLAIAVSDIVVEQLSMLEGSRTKGNGPDTP